MLAVAALTAAACGCRPGARREGQAGGRCARGLGGATGAVRRLERGQPGRADRDHPRHPRAGQPAGQRGEDARALRQGRLPRARQHLSQAVCRRASGCTSCTPVRPASPPLPRSRRRPGWPSCAPRTPPTWTPRRSRPRARCWTWPSTATSATTTGSTAWAACTRWCGSKASSSGTRRWSSAACCTADGRCERATSRASGCARTGGGRGHAAAMMEALERVVRGAYDLGALSATAQAADLYSAAGLAALGGADLGAHPGRRRAHRGGRRVGLRPPRVVLAGSLRRADLRLARGRPLVIAGAT